MQRALLLTCGIAAALVVTSGTPVQAQEGFTEVGGRGASDAQLQQLRGLINGTYVAPTHRVAKATVKAAGAVAASPAILSPSEGGGVAGEFALEVTSQGPFGVFVDGVWVENHASGGVTSFNLPETVIAGSVHSIGVASCVDETCAAYNEQSDAVSVVGYPAQTIDSLSTAPSRFSPNGDQHSDTVTTKLSVKAPGALSMKVVRASTGTVVRTANLGSVAEGERTWVWNGKNQSGQGLSSGLFRISATLVTTGGSVSTDQVEATVDVTGASWTSLKSSIATVFPRRDSYKDSVTFSGNMSEAVSSVRLQVLTLTGMPIRTYTVSNESKGAKSVTWYGKDSRGRNVPAGTYRYRFITRDLAGNARNSATQSIKVDSRILRAHTGIKAVIPEVGFDYALRGSCSDIFKNVRSGWTGSHGYYSLWYLTNSGFCGFSDTLDTAGAAYSMVLPSAIKYGSASVSVTGQADVAGKDDDRAFLVLDDRHGDLVNDSGVFTGSTYGSTSTGSFPVSSLSPGRTINWIAASFDGDWYDVRFFKVTWTYYVLSK